MNAGLPREPEPPRAVEGGGVEVDVRTIGRESEDPHRVGVGVDADDRVLSAAPKSASRLTDTGRFLVEMAVFGLSTLALVAAGQTLLAISFAVVAVLNASFLLVAPRS